MSDSKLYDNHVVNGDGGGILFLSSAQLLMQVPMLSSDPNVEFSQTSSRRRRRLNSVTSSDNQVYGVRLDNINFVNNSINASKNSALATAAGGSLAIVGDYGEIIMIKNSTFVGNSARFGGAISVKKGGIVYVNTSRFFSNTALEIGGAGSGGDGGIIYADG